MSRLRQKKGKPPKLPGLRAPQSTENGSDTIRAMHDYLVEERERGTDEDELPSKLAQWTQTPESDVLERRQAILFTQAEDALAREKQDEALSPDQQVIIGAAALLKRREFVEGAIGIPVVAEHTRLTRAMQVSTSLLGKFFERYHMVSSDDLEDPELADILRKSERGEGLPFYPSDPTSVRYGVICWELQNHCATFVAKELKALGLSHPKIDEHYVGFGVFKEILDSSGEKGKWRLQHQRDLAHLLDLQTTRNFERAKNSLGDYFTKNRPEFQAMVREHFESWIRYFKEHPDDQTGETDERSGEKHEGVKEKEHSIGAQILEADILSKVGGKVRDIKEFEGMEVDEKSLEHGGKEFWYSYARWLERKKEEDK